MARADRVPFLLERPLVTVRATLNEHDDISLAVDTGAERTVISRQAAMSLGLDLDRPLRWQTLLGVGRSSPVPVVRLDWLRVGASTASGLAVFVYDLPALIRADGLLGLHFLRRFRVTVAFDAGMLILREPPAR